MVEVSPVPSYFFGKKQGNTTFLFFPLFSNCFLLAFSQANYKLYKLLHLLFFIYYIINITLV